MEILEFEAIALRVRVIDPTRSEITLYLRVRFNAPRFQDRDRRLQLFNEKTDYHRLLTRGFVIGQAEAVAPYFE